MEEQQVLQHLTYYMEIHYQAYLQQQKQEIHLMDGLMEIHS